MENNNGGVSLTCLEARIVVKQTIIGAKCELCALAVRKSNILCEQI